MKAIFLDVDGALNGFDNWPKDAHRYWIDTACVDRLNRITRTTDAVIVVTSTWRHSKRVDVCEALGNAGVEACVIGVTPHLAGSRGDEIAEWLSLHEDVTKFVIIDDDADMGELSEALVQTDFFRGLQDGHVPVAIAKLT